MKDIHGSLWFVIKDFHSKETSVSDNGVKGRKVLIETGEILEFRYESERNFRDMDNNYWETDIKTWDKCCIRLGTILERVRFENKATLKEIWRLNLFDFDENGKKIYQQYLEELKKEAA